MECRKGPADCADIHVSLGACGTSVLNLPIFRGRLDYSKLKSEMYRPRVATEQAYRVLEYMHGLLKYSPPNILELDADSALENFMHGRSAMIYCWGSNASRLEYDAKSRSSARSSTLCTQAVPEALASVLSADFCWQYLRHCLRSEHAWLSTLSHG